MQIEPVTLSGRVVRLEPMKAEHCADFIQIGLGHDIFRWFPWSVDTPEQMQASVEACLAGQKAGVVLPFTTIEQSSGRVIGSTCYLAIDRANRRLEIGATWIAPPWQRTAANTEAKYLQLTHCFETLGTIRVEFKTDALNERSRAALLRIAAREEGIFRNHMVCPGGRIRDSAYYSVIDREWPEVKTRLAGLLARA